MKKNSTKTKDSKEKDNKTDKNKDNKESKSKTTIPEKGNSKPEKVVYSELGYIQVDKAEFENTDLSHIAFKKKKQNMEGRLSKQNLSEKIAVNLKTLYGKRKVYNFEVNIHDKLSCLVKLLIEEENITGEKIKWEENFQYRLISTNGLIKELNPCCTFAEEEIKNNFTLILASPYKVNFSETMKHQGICVCLISCLIILFIFIILILLMITVLLLYFFALLLLFIFLIMLFIIINYKQLEELNSVAHNQSGIEDHLLVLCDRGYKTGKHYIEFILETEPCESSTIIGITHLRSDYYFDINSHKNFWGYIPSEGSKIGNNEIKEIGLPSKIKDKIGLLMQFGLAGLDLILFINNKEIATLYKNLPIGPLYYPCSVLKFDGMKIRVSNRAPIPLHSTH